MNSALLIEAIDSYMFQLICEALDKRAAAFRLYKRPAAVAGMYDAEASYLLRQSKALEAKREALSVMRADLSATV